MVRRWVCGVVVVAVILGSLGWSAPAMEEEPEPSDYYFAEFVGGELGTILGGITGTYLGHRFFESRHLGVTSLGVLGIALGAGSGVTLWGLMAGIEGNVLGAYIGPSLWAIAIVLRPNDLGIVLSFTVLFLPAILATIGFNIGAKMKDTGQPASLPWTLDLPVLALEF